MLANTLRDMQGFGQRITQMDDGEWTAGGQDVEGWLSGLSSELATRQLCGCRRGRKRLSGQRQGTACGSSTELASYLKSLLSLNGR